MTNMFKKTLLAAAIAGVSSSALAVDITTAAGDDGDGNPVAVSFSAQGVAAIANNQLDTDPAAVQFTAGASYAVNDVIRITVTGADIDTTNSAPTLTVSDAGGEVGADAEIGFLSYDGNEMIFRVTSVQSGDAGFGSGDTMDLTGLVLEADSAGSSISVEYAAETNSGLPIDNTGTTSAEVVTIDEQFEAAVDTAFDGVIDVSEQRVLFDDAGTTDVLTLEITDNATQQLAVTAGEIVHTIYGNFSDLVDDNGDALTAAAFASAAANAGSGEADDTFAYEFAEDMQSITITQTVVNAVDDLVDVTFDVDGGSAAAASAIATQDFTADVSVTDGADPAETFASFTGVDVGEWTLNGAEAYVPYMPYGQNISQVLYVTNNGSQTGDITVDIRDEAGNVTSNVNVGQAAPGITKITSEVLAAVEEATGKNLNPLTGTGSEKVALTIVVNAPSDDIEVYSSYNVNGNDRGYISNSSNR